MQSRAWLLVTAIAVAGCDDFAPPAELIAATVVGILAEPPVVAAGKTTLLTPLIASPGGPLPARGAVWQLTETLPGVPPFGQLEANADGTARYRAPAVLPTLPANALPVDSVQLELSLDGRTSRSIKTVLVADVATLNPELTVVTADGVPIDDGLEVEAGVAVELAVTTEPAATERSRYAWYVSIGSIERYQSSPCSYLAKTAGAGWLYVVVRDGQLGVAWRAIPIVVR